jgi:hypothetical protein
MLFTATLETIGKASHVQPLGEGPVSLRRQTGAKVTALIEVFLFFFFRNARQGMSKFRIS